jgi:hypothetical protein
MSSTILTNWTVYYADDATAGNGHKQIRWTGSGTPQTSTNTINELYSALADLFSNPNQNQADDTIPMRAITPTVYQIGSFDAGDLEPWFIDPESMQHITGGSLQTVGWQRTLPGTGSGDIGIVKITRSGTNIVAGDVGASITNATGGDDGVLLFVDGTELWIRPDTNTSADDWNSTSGNITCNGHTDTQTAAGVTGERLWSNIYTLGSIAPNTTITVFQNTSEITPYWDTGHIDRLILINDGFNAGLINQGYLTVYARQYTTVYDHFQSDVALGGRSPIPLSTFSDTNNPTGFRTFTGSAGTGTFDTGNLIYVGSTFATATKKGVLTTDASGTTPTIIYYPSGAMTDFVVSDAIKEYDPVAETDGDATCTAGAPTNTGPANISGVTLTFGATTYNLGNGYGNAPYDLEIDCSGETLANIYEYLKYLTRRGSTTSINGREGQIYKAVGEIKLAYDTQTGNFTEGLTVTGANSGATGVIVADHNTNPTGAMTLRDITGNFENNELLTDTSIGSATTAIPTGVESITEVKRAPFGTFAGGKFFGARGVLLTNMATADASNYLLTDSDNNEQIPPSYINLTVNNVAIGDRIGVFLATGDNNIVDKSTYTIQSTHTAPLSYIRVSESIPTDTPETGYIRVVRRNGSGTIIDEQRYPYISYSNANQPTYSEFTLSSTITVNYDTDDTAYVPFIDATATGTSYSTALIYLTNRFVTVRVRQKGYLPFITKGQITDSGLFITAVKTTDTITD